MAPECDKHPTGDRYAVCAGDIPSDERKRTHGVKLILLFQRLRY